MMIEGMAVVDKSKDIENYLEIARNAMEAENYREAEEYCNRIIEIDVNNWEAWFIKGKSAGWQSTLDNSRINESVNVFLKMLEVCPNEKKEDLREKCKLELENLLSALLSLRMKQFKYNPNNADYDGLKSDINSILKTTTDFLHRTSIIYDKFNYTRFAYIIYIGICNAWNEISKDYFSIVYPSDFDFRKFIDEEYFLVEALKIGLVLIENKEDDKETNDLKIDIYSTMISMERKTMDANSYEMNYMSGYKKYVKNLSLTKEAKKKRLQFIGEWTEKIQEIKTVWEKKVAEAAEQRKIAYWKNHTEEKEQLENEKESLVKNIEILNKQIENIPEKKEIIRLNENLNVLKLEKKSISLFKREERKEIQEKINTVNKEILEITKKIKNVSSEIEQKIDSMKRN